MNRLLVILGLLGCLSGCAAPEVLLPRAGAVPVDVDLTGYWELRSDAAESRMQVRDAVRKTDGVKDDDVFRKSERQNAIANRRGRPKGVRGGLVHVFLELGESLKVTQTADGLFISFDRSIVEEYRFGESRMISVGEVQAQRVTGWEGDTLVVDTLDRNSMKMTDRFRLLQNDRVLERTIIFRSRKLEEVTIVQTFDRAQ